MFRRRAFGKTTSAFFTRHTFFVAFHVRFETKYQDLDQHLSGVFKADA
jgi:hypothetical protein